VIYLDSNNSATRVVGRCTNDNTTDNPSPLLTQAIIASPIKGAWNTVSVSAVTLTSGTKYWIAVLSPTAPAQSVSVMSRAAARPR
jgi:hypothetical protein